MRPVQPPTVLDAGSPAREVLERLADRWTSMLICALATGLRRYGELRRQLHGVSSKMLTQTLHGLERDGLVIRTVHPTRPPRVEYALTPLGQTLVEPLAGLLAWAEVHFPELQAARDGYNRDA
jgi:DNA-binding HxlR family transcriptional regulator